MASFLARGWSCSLVDYTPRTVPGVTRLGETLDDLPSNMRFDLILCSHVFEHIANPLETARALREHLADNGILYIEVPMEIWRRPPIHEEPVTHVNFFTGDSLEVLLRRAGYRVRACRLGSCLLGAGLRETVIRAWAQPALRAHSENEISFPSGCADRTRQLLSPGILPRLQMAYARPDRLLSRLRGLLDAVYLGRLFAFRPGRVEK